MRSKPGNDVRCSEQRWERGGAGETRKSPAGETVRSGRQPFSGKIEAHTRSRSPNKTLIWRSWAPFKETQNWGATSGGAERNRHVPFSRIWKAKKKLGKAKKKKASPFGPDSWGNALGLGRKQVTRATVPCAGVGFKGPETWENWGKTLHITIHSVKTGSPNSDGRIKEGNERPDAPKAWQKKRGAEPAPLAGEVRENGKRGGPGKKYPLSGRTPEKKSTKTENGKGEGGD